MGDCILRSSAAGGKENSMYFDQVEFGKRVKELRRLRGYTQESLAERLSISHVHENLIENGKHGCSVDLIMEIASVFHVSLDYLMTGEEFDHAEARNRLLTMAGELMAMAKDA